MVGAEERAAVDEVLRSGALVQGKQVALFEEKFAAYHGARHGIATNNGTSALTAALMAHRIGPGDEVIVPAFTFFATASCVLSVGATPRFADIELATYCLDVESVKAAITPKTRAAIAVHLYGHPADLEALQALCDERRVVLIQDAAQAHGAAIDNNKVGSSGTAAFSFYPTKNMTTTEGGMVLTDDDGVAERLRMIRNQGMNTRYFHEVVGYNLRMTDLCAAIGLVQLEKLPQWTEQRIANATYYCHNLQGVVTPATRAGCTHVFHQFTVRVAGGKTSSGLTRDELVARLNEAGIGVRVYYPLPLHRQPVFVEMKAYDNVRLPVTEVATSEVFSLPVHPALSSAEREEVVAKVSELC